MRQGGTMGSGGSSGPGASGDITGVTAGDGLTGGGASGGVSLAVDGTVVRTSRQIVSGAGLTGGGDLSGDRTLAVGEGTGITVNANDIQIAAAQLALISGAVQAATRQVISGAGLTGGGDLSADRTLAVGQGDGVTVSADAVAVDATVVRTTRTLTASTGLTGGGDLSADRSIAIDLTAALIRTALQTVSIDDAGTTTVARGLTARHKSSGTVAAGFGAGFTLVAEDASNNDDDAAYLDSLWLVATDGATQASAFSVQVRTANAMGEVMRVGGGVSSSLLDVNGFASIGRCLIDNRADDIAYFSHRDMSTTSNYAVFQNASGATRFNCASGQSLTLMYNATQRFHANATGIGFHATNGVAAQTSGANLTNNVTAGGTNDTIDNWTDLTLYSTDAAAIRNAVHQLARKLKQINDGLRTYGLFT